MFKILRPIVLMAVIVCFCAGHSLSQAAAQSPQERPSTRVGKSEEVEEATVVDPKHISESSRIRGRLYSLGYKDMEYSGPEELHRLKQQVVEGKQVLWQELKRRISGPLYEWTPCPYCGGMLRTRQAKQCRHCGRDWHDPDQVTDLKPI